MEKKATNQIIFERIIKNIFSVFKKRKEKKRKEIKQSIQKNQKLNEIKDEINNQISPLFLFCSYFFFWNTIFKICILKCQ